VFDGMPKMEPLSFFISRVCIEGTSVWALLMIFEEGWSLHLLALHHPPLHSIPHHSFCVEVGEPQLFVSILAICFSFGYVPFGQDKKRVGLPNSSRTQKEHGWWIPTCSFPLRECSPSQCWSVQSTLFPSKSPLSHLDKI